MTAVEIVLAILQADARVTAIVPLDEIAAGALEQGINPPALLINTISVVYAPSLRGTPLSTARIQVTVFAQHYQQQVALIELVRAVLSNQRVNAGGVPGASIRADHVGPDFRDPDASLWAQTIDFRVSIPA